MIQRTLLSLSLYMNFAITMRNTLAGGREEFGLLVGLVMSHSISQPLSLFVRSLGSLSRAGNPWRTMLRPSSGPGLGGRAAAGGSDGGATAWMARLARSQRQTAPAS